jgi:hypothetical protein
LGHSATVFSNCAGLVKSSAEWLAVIAMKVVHPGKPGQAVGQHPSQS